MSTHAPSITAQGLQAMSYAAMAPHQPLVSHPITRRKPGPNDVLIDVHYCGICHSDIHQVRNDWGEGVFPMVPGHEITGVVAEAGSAVKKWKTGDAVGVGCMVDSCRQCEPCQSGEEQFCTKGPSFTYNSYEQDKKTPTYGGYSTRITVHQDFVVRIPKKLPLDKAAPLLCAGITTYSPLKRFDVHKGNQIAVVGLGGLGHMGVKIAKAMGAHVSVLSHSPSKKVDALRLGADEFIVTNGKEAFEKNAGRFNFILDTVSAAHDYNAYLKLLKRDSTMVIVGVPPASPIEPFTLIMGRRSIAGSIIGGIRETQEMLDFCDKHAITSDIELIGPEKINEAFERTIRSDVKYRFVVDVRKMV